MKSLFSFLILALLLATTSFAQKNTILEIGKQKVSLDEFERIYQKNNSQLNDSSEVKTPAEYMNMFIDFKLKVIEAENQGLDTAKAFVDELAGYRTELAKPYLTDVSYTDSMVHQAFYRITHEVRASHILIMVAEDASPEDTLKAYQKIMDVRQKFLNKEKTFAELAKEYSEDPSAATNGGDLGYFRAFQMVTPFENAAFSTKPGEVSYPIRSRFGYHLVYVQDLRDAKSDIKVAHIMKMFSNPDKVSPDEDKKMKEKIDSIYALIQKGEDFGDLAHNYSDDRRSALNGGEMNWINSSFSVHEFTDAAYALEKDGDISVPIRTNYGWHIIKRIQLRPQPTFDEMKEELTSKIKADPERSKYNRISFISKLKKEYSFTENNNNIEKFKTFALGMGKDSMAVGLNSEMSNLPFFKIEGKTYTSSDYANYLVKNKKGADKIAASIAASSISNFEDDMIVAYEDARLETKYPDFYYLLKEYHDGILLFSVMEKEVWNKAMTDSVGLELYAQKFPGKYVWGEYFDGLHIKCENQDVRGKVDTLLAAGEKDPEKIKQIINTEGKNLVSVTKGKWEKGDNKVVDYYIWGQAKPDKLNESLEFVYGDKKNGGAKTLEEARGLYISDYQEYLDKEWLKTLHDKYSVTINKKLLKKVKAKN